MEIKTDKAAFDWQLAMRKFHDAQEAILVKYLNPWEPVSRLAKVFLHESGDAERKMFRNALLAGLRSLKLKGFRSPLQP